MYRSGIRIAALAVMAAALALPAHGVILFLPGNHPQANEENVLLNNGTSGNTVKGLTQSSGFEVDFHSSLQTLVEPANGQARITSADENVIPVTNLLITLPGGSFTDIIFNPFVNGSTPFGGPATVTVIDGEGSVFLYQLANGSNFLTILATGGDTMTEVSIDAPGGFSDLRQVRISGASNGTPIPPTGFTPEPGSLTMLFGLLTGGCIFLRPLRRLRR